MRHALRKAGEFLLRLPFVPADTVGSNHEEVGGMPDADRPTGPIRISELDPRRLIVELQGRRVVLVFVDTGQFVAMALCLDRDPHLPTGIANGHVPRATAHAAARWRRANCGDDRGGLFRQTEALTKLNDLVVSEQGDLS